MRWRHGLIALSALACAASAGSARAELTTGAVRLLGIRPDASRGGYALVLEASAPVAYVTRQPDPLTVLLDLRGVTPSEGAGRNQLQGPRSPVTRVDVGQATARDGATLTTVRLLLSAPAAPIVHAERNTIRVEFPEQHATLSQPPATAATQAATGGGASRLEAVSATDADGRTTVTLRGNGRLSPRSVQEARDQPPRLVIDLPEVEAAVPPVTPVDSSSVARIRVAANSVAPLVTRVVVDLKQRVPFSVEQRANDIVLVLGAPQATVASVQTPPTSPVPARPPSTVTAAPASAKPALPNDLAYSTTRSVPTLPGVSHDTAAFVPPSTAAGKPPATTASAPERVAAKPPAQPEPVMVRAQQIPAAAGTASGGQTGDRSTAPTLVATTATSGSSVAANTDVLAAPATPATSRPAAASNAAVTAPSSFATTASDASPTAPAAGQSTAASSPSSERPQPLNDSTDRQFTGHPVSLDFQGVDLRAVLRTFSEITGLNIVIDPSVQGTVDVALKEVPWDQALDIILRANQLGYTVEGNIVRIAPLGKLREEQEERRKLAEARALSGDLEMLTRTLSYAKAEEMTQLLTRAALTQRGSIQIDRRTNTLIVRDLPGGLDAASQLIDRLDQAQPQVEIEARIVQTSRNFLRELGVQWGIGLEASQRRGNPLPLSYPNSVGVQGTTTNPTVGEPNSVIGLVTSSINGAFNLDVALQAAETAGKVRILSTPRVSTQNNVEAEISQGTQIPVQTIANNTVTVTFKDATLTLKVRPQITSSNTVIMNVVVENGAPDYTREVNGIPPIDTQRANTQVQVDDGATTVIGGIFVSSERQTEDRTPGLHRLPLLGWLFKSDNRADESRELLIFLTPRIIKG